MSDDQATAMLASYSIWKGTLLTEYARRGCTATQKQNSCGKCRACLQLQVLWQVMLRDKVSATSEYACMSVQTAVAVQNAGHSSNKHVVVMRIVARATRAGTMKERMW